MYYPIRFYCDVPDEFLFAPNTNLKEVAKAVKIGEKHFCGGALSLIAVFIFY
jgi:hypothetical protein